MPTTLHQGAARLLVDEPEQAFSCLRSVFGLELPEFVRVQTRHAVLDRHLPMAGDTGELRPDALLSAESPGDPLGGLGLIIEAQRRPDPIKHRRLWVYWAHASEELRRSTAVLMIALSDAVSRWARSLGQYELPPREGLLVLDRHNMPVVRDPATARRLPAWSTLSAMIHGVHGDLDALKVVLPVVLSLEDERRWRYASYLLCAVDPQSRAILEGAMSTQRIPISDIERRSIAFHDGREEGRTEGRAEGRTEGRTEVLRELVETVVELRGLPVTVRLRRALEGCASLEGLRLAQRRARGLRQASELGELIALLEAHA